MLFDLRGKRKRVVQASYALLALLFVVGFLGFGIGVGGGLGGIFDALGLRNGNTGSSDAVLQAHVDAANKKLAKDPKDSQALLRLADNEYLLGKAGVQVDPNTGQPTAISNEAHTHLGNAADAWTKYLKVNKGKPDLNVAFDMVNAYILLNDAQGAAKTQAVIVDAQPSTQSYGQLAYFQYFAGDIKGGDASRKKALAMAPPAQRKQLESSLKRARQTGIKIQQQQQKARKQAKKQAGTTTTAPGSNPLQSPFGGLGTSP